MSFTLNVAVILGVVYLAGIVEFAVWCYNAPVAPEVLSSDE